MIKCGSYNESHRHREKIKTPTFRALALRQSESRNFYIGTALSKEGEATPFMKTRKRKNMTYLVECKTYVDSAGTKSAANLEE